MTNKTKGTKGTEQMKKVFSMLAAIVMVASIASTIVSANANSIQTNGNSSVLCFKIGNLPVFCADPKLLSPKSGMEYEKVATTRDFTAFNSVFVNMFLYKDEKDEVFYRVSQQALWSKVDNSKNYRDKVAIILGENGVSLFDTLIAPVDIRGYVISYTAYSTNEPGYQTMVSAVVSKASVVESTTQVPSTTVRVDVTTTTHAITTTVTPTYKPVTEYTRAVADVPTTTQTATKTTTSATVIVTPKTQVSVPETVVITTTTEAPKVDVLGYEVEFPPTGSSAIVPAIAALAIAIAVMCILKKK